MGKTQFIQFTMDERELNKLLALGKINDIDDKDSIVDALHSIIYELPEPINKEDLDAAREWIREQVKNLTYGNMAITISPSGYDDRIPPQFILKAFNEYCNIAKSNNNDYETFKDYLEAGSLLADINAHYFDLVEEQLLHEIKYNIQYESEELQSLFEALIDGMNDYEILEVGGFEGINYDIKEFLDYDYRINLMFATPYERNCDMSLIPLFEDVDNNALTYLIRQQGYDVHEVFKSLKEDRINDSVFVRSVVDELREQSYCMAELTALVTVRGENLLNLLDNIAHENNYISISKDATIGLFNEWNGSGAMLEIQLEKPAVFPTSMVRNVQIEGAGKENSGYTVDAVYGFVSKAWLIGNVEIVNEAPALKEENFDVNIKKNRSDKTIVKE